LQQVYSLSTPADQPEPTDLPEEIEEEKTESGSVVGSFYKNMPEKHKFKVGKLTDDHIALLSRVGSLIFDSVTYNLDEWKPIRGDSRRLMFESFEVGASKATDLQQGCIAFGDHFLASLCMYRQMNYDDYVVKVTAITDRMDGIACGIQNHHKDGSGLHFLVNVDGKLRVEFYDPELNVKSLVLLSGTGDYVEFGGETYHAGLNVIGQRLHINVVSRNRNIATQSWSPRSQTFVLKDDELASKCENSMVMHTNNSFSI
jgi:hypothetical protein